MCFCLRAHEFFGVMWNVCFVCALGNEKQTIAVGMRLTYRLTLRSCVWTHILLLRFQDMTCTRMFLWLLWLARQRQGSFRRLAFQSFCGTLLGFGKRSLYERREWEGSSPSSLNLMVQQELFRTEFSVRLNGLVSANEYSVTNNRKHVKVEKLRSCSNSGSRHSCCSEHLNFRF